MVELVFTPWGAASRAFLSRGRCAHSGRWLCEQRVTLLSAQELSKITMPVIFNEPLSFLQRLTEYMEHTYLIQKASSLSDPAERMQVGGGASPGGLVQPQRLPCLPPPLPRPKHTDRVL